MKTWKMIFIEGSTYRIQETIDRLDEFQVPIEKIQVVSESAYCGEILESVNGPILVGRIEDIFESGFDVAFIMSPVGCFEELVRTLVHGGIPVLDGSGIIKPGPSIPLVFPEYPPEGIRSFPAVSVFPSMPGIITSLIAKPVHDLFQLESIHCAAVQSVSEKGNRAAMDELFDQTRSMFGFKDIVKSEFMKQIAFSYLPLHDVSAIESRLRIELSEFLQIPELEVRLDISWVPVFIGFAGTLWLKTRRPIEVDGIESEFKKIHSITIDESAEPVGILDAVGRDEIIISGIRTIDSSRHNLTLRFAVDNLRKGSASHFAQILKQLQELGAS